MSGKATNVENLDSRIIMDQEITVLSLKEQLCGNLKKERKVLGQKLIKDDGVAFLSNQDENLIQENKKQIKRLKLEIQAYRDFEKDINESNRDANSIRQFSFQDVGDSQIRKELQKTENYIKKSHEYDVNKAYKAYRQERCTI